MGSCVEEVRARVKEAAGSTARKPKAMPAPASPEREGADAGSRLRRRKMGRLRPGGARRASGAAGAEAAPTPPAREPRRARRSRRLPPRRPKPAAADRLKLPEDGGCAAILAGGGARGPVRRLRPASAAAAATTAALDDSTRRPRERRKPSAALENAGRTRAKNVTEAILKPVDGSDAERRRRSSAGSRTVLALQVAARRACSRRAKASLHVSLVRSPSECCRWPRPKSAKTGTIAGRSKSRRQCSACLAAGLRPDGISIIRTDDSQLEAVAGRRRTNEKKAPDYTGDDVLARHRSPARSSAPASDRRRRQARRPASSLPGFMIPAGSSCSLSARSDVEARRARPPPPCRGRGRGRPRGGG